MGSLPVSCRPWGGLWRWSAVCTRSPALIVAPTDITGETFVLILFDLLVCLRLWFMLHASFVAYAYCQSVQLLAFRSHHLCNFIFPLKMTSDLM